MNNLLPGEITLEAWLNANAEFLAAEATDCRKAAEQAWLAREPLIERLRTLNRQLDEALRIERGRNHAEATEQQLALVEALNMYAPQIQPADADALLRIVGVIAKANATAYDNSGG